MDEAINAQTSNIQEATKLDRALSGAFELVTQLAEVDPKTRRRRKRLCIPTGFGNIDCHISGLWPGELTVVTGGPGVGKTTFAANLAVNAAKFGTRVLLIALGTNIIETVIRMCAAEGRIEVGKLLDGRIDQDDWGSLTDASNRLATLDLYICDDAQVTPEAIRSIALSASEGAERTLVVIDGTELVSLPDEERIFEWPHTLGSFLLFLKKLAREIDSPIVATVSHSPFARRTVRDFDNVIRALPADVTPAPDSVLHIDRYLAECDPEDIPSQTVAEIIIAKNRMCAPTHTRLAFVPKYMRFMDYADDSLKRR